MRKDKRPLSSGALLGDVGGGGERKPGLLSPGLGRLGEPTGTFVIRSEEGGGGGRCSFIAAVCGRQWCGSPRARRPPLGVSSVRAGAHVPGSVTMESWLCPRRVCGLLRHSEPRVWGRLGAGLGPIREIGLGKPRGRDCPA